MKMQIIYKDMSDMTPEESRWIIASLLAGIVAIVVGAYLGIKYPA